MKKIAATLLVVLVSGVLCRARSGNLTPYTLDRKQSKLEIHVYREGFLKALATTTSFLRQSCPARCNSHNRTSRNRPSPLSRQPRLLWWSIRVKRKRIATRFSRPCWGTRCLTRPDTRKSNSLLLEFAP